MTQIEQKSSRKKFLHWCGGILAVIPMFAFMNKKKPATSDKVKMLTEDGKLVEIDLHRIPTSTQSQKISDEAVHDWIKSN